MAIGKRRKPSIIAIAGCSGCGKSTLARRLGKRLRSPVIPIDAYYRDQADVPVAERALLNFDDPAAVEHERLIEDLRALQARRVIRRPVYDFTTHTRRRKVIRVAARTFIVLEGLFALSWAEVRDLCCLKVYIDTEDAVSYRRRLRRDMRERGRTEDSVMRQYRDTVYPMAKLHIKPTREYADLVLRGDEPADLALETVLAALDE